MRVFVQNQGMREILPRTYSWYSKGKKLSINIGQFLKDFLKWFFVIVLLYLLAKYTRVQDEPRGNPGVAVM